MNALVIDAKSGQPHPLGSEVVGSIGAALHLFGGAGSASARYDAAGRVDTRCDALAKYHRHFDRKIIDEYRTVRQDALGAGAGGFPRDFEHIRQKIWEEKRQPLNAMRLFPIDREVPLGAKTHTARRAVGSGEAEVHRGGTDFPTVRTSYVEEQFGVVYVVTSVDVNYFEALSNDFAGRNQYQRDMRLGMRMVEERLNRIAWNGYEPGKVYGVLNYPHLAKMKIARAFTSASTGEQIVAALNDLVNESYIQSGGTFQGNRMGVSPRLHRFLHQTKYHASGGTDTTIAEFFLKGQDPSTGIRTIDVAQELAGVGPNSEDGILVYRDDAEATAHVVIQPPTPLPVFQSSPIDNKTVIFAATGGMVMGDVGHNILGYAEV